MSLSKVFRTKLHGLTCSDVYHPGESCAKMHTSNARRVVPAMAIFFIPLVFIPLVRKLRNASGRDVLHALGLYVRMSSSACLASWMTQAMWCGLYHLTGSFTPFTIMFLPTLIGNAAVFLLPHQAAGYFANTIFAPIVESVIRRNLPMLQSSRFVQTALFMCMSTIILDSLARVPDASDIFWFLQPHRYRSMNGLEPSEPSRLFDRVLPVEHRVCQHRESCDKHVSSGIKTYWNIGLVLEIVRITFRYFPQLKRRPSEFLTIYTSQMKFRLISFMVGYATIYRALNCTLNRTQMIDMKLSHVVASFLAGASFLCYPSLTLLSHATAATLKLLWMRRTKDSKSITSKVFVDRLPMAQIVYMLCIAYAFHIRIFAPKTTSGFIFKMTQITSGNRFDGISANIQRLLAIDR